MWVRVCIPNLYTLYNGISPEEETVTKKRSEETNPKYREKYK